MAFWLKHNQPSVHLMDYYWGVDFLYLSGNYRGTAFTKNANFRYIRKGSN
jgi:hypothetical protein